MSAQELITKHLDVWTSAHKTRSIAGRGSNNKLNLYGIKKLRELILELAIRGKLVPQDPSDEPASELVNKIEAEKYRLVDEGKLKKQKPLLPVCESEELFDLPNGWAWERLNNIYDVRDGTHDTPKYYETGFPLVTSKNLSSGVLDLTDVKYISESDHLKITERSKVDSEDILFAMIGSIGNPVLVDVEPNFSIKNVALFKYYKKSLSSPSFLLRFLVFASVKMKEEASGAVQSFVSLGTVRNFAIALPPLAEQRRIVAKVDELMAFCDQLEQTQSDNIAAHAQLVEALLATLTNSSDHNELQNNWQRIAAHFDTLFTTEHSIDQLKQTILQLAVMGKLVPQNPNDEPASQLLKKIAAEKVQLLKEGKIKKEKPLPEITDEEKPFELPSGWEWAKLGAVTTGMDSGWSPACLANNSPSDEIWGVLKTTSVQVMEYLEFENKELPANLNPRPDAEVKTGDILFTRAGPMNRVGISCLVQKTRPRLMISDKIIRFHPVEIGIYGRFIALCLNAGATATYLENAKSGMAASQVNITQDNLRSAPIPIAPLNEQHSIVVKVDELMALCDTLKTNLQNAQTTQLALADALVEQAVN